MIPGWGRSPGEGKGNPLQYSCLEKPMDRGSWQALVHGVARVRHNLGTKPPPPPRFVIVFLPRSKHLLTSRLQSLSTVILDPKKMKSVTASTFPPSFYLPWVDGIRCHDLSFWNVEFQASFITLLFHPHQEAL